VARLHAEVGDPGVCRGDATPSAERQRIQAWPTTAHGPRHSNCDVELTRSVDTQDEGLALEMEVQVSRPRRFFPPEYKAEVIELIRSTGKTVGQVARELDLTETVVRQWSAKLIWTQVAVAMG
jgi:hypothetical protein